MPDYVFARWRKARGGGREPALPRGTDYLQLAEPGRGATWALWSVSAPLRKSGAVVPVDAALRDLLRSAQSYPPALALARAEVARTGRPRWGPVSLARACAAALREALDARPSAPFLRAERRTDEVGYATRGDFSWLLRYVPRAGPGAVAAVDWVSGDFHIYRNPASDFRLTPAMRRRLRAAGRRT